MSTQGKVAVGHPVDVATGTMFNAWVDFVVGGMVPLAFSRFYSSALASRGVRGPIGLGWRHEFQHELRQTVEGFAYVDAHGAEVAIEDLEGEFGSRGRLIVARDRLELRGTVDEIELVPYGPGQPYSYWFKRRRGTTRYLLRAIGRNASLRLQLDYDDFGRLARVVQKRSGRALTLEHDGNDRIAAVWYESQGRRDLAVRLAYDGAGHLVGATRQSGEAWRYEYDRAGLMLSDVSNRGALHTFRYDASSRCVYASGADRFEERQLTYFPREHRTQVADSHGEVTTYRYNDAGQVVETVNPLGQKEQFEFDDAGRMVAITDASGKSARMEYDAWGHICAATYPDGQRASATFDERLHVPVTMSDYWGHVWRYEYDDRGQLLRSTNPSGLEWRYAYNEHGEVVTVRNPAGASAVTGWDDAGNPHFYRDADGGEWHKEYDHYGRCTAARNPLGGVRRFEFGASGELVRVTDPEGRVHETRLDAARQARTTDTPEVGRWVTLLNACGKPVEEYLPDGSVLRYEWDTEPGRLLSIADGLGRSMRYTYDAAGRVIGRQSWDGKHTQLERDPLGRLTAVIDPTGGRTEYAYNDWGNLVKRTAADGAVTSYAYDANSFPIRIETADTLVELERDYYGRVLAERQNGVAVTYRYDAAGRRVELRSDLGADVRYDWTPGGLCAAVGYRGKDVRFEYDPLGREVACELAGSWRLEQRYDPFHRLLTQVCTRTTGVDASATAAAGGTRVVAREYRYGPDGHLASVSDSLRGAARFVHDRLGRLHAFIRPPDRIECFGYDRAHNRAYAVRADDDAVSPLVEELDRGRTIEPRELTTGEEVERTERGAGNETIRLTRGARTVRYEYDARGRLVHKHVDDAGVSQRWSFEWNGTGQLVAVQRPDGARWSYQYDGIGRRTAKIAPGGERRTYVWDRDTLLHDTAAGDTTTWVEHPNARAPLVCELRGRVEFAVLDHVGAVSERLDERGNVTWRSRRGPWGEPGEREEGAPGFPGQQLDAESGLYYNRHRYYDPELGKYISPDPVGLLGGLNDYAYVPSPIEWADPLGLWGGGPLLWKSKQKNNTTYPDLRLDENRFVGRGVGADGELTGVRSVQGPGGKKRVFDLDDQGKKYKVDGKWARKDADFGPDSGGKTLALITGPSYDNDAAHSVFVSGYTENHLRDKIDEETGKPTGKRYTTEETAERLDQRARALFGDEAVNHLGTNGNFSHAEIQAVVWLTDSKTRIDDDYGGHAHVYIDRPPCELDAPCCHRAMNHFLATNEEFRSKVTIHYVKTEGGELTYWKMFYDPDMNEGKGGVRNVPDPDAPCP